MPIILICYKPKIASELNIHVATICRQKHYNRVCKNPEKSVFNVLFFNTSFNSNYTVLSIRKSICFKYSMSKSKNLYNPLKKTMDKLISFVLFIMLLPLFSIILLSIFVNGLFRHQDKGSFIFRERRYSQGECFYILKFRVLRMEFIEKVHSMGQHARIYEKNISNLTLVGCYLKKWYLDELPQLINIFVGDMSLVGPRPWIEKDFLGQLNKGIDYRKYTIAGWTGPGQLCENIGSSANLASHSEAADIQYVAKLRTLNPFSLFFYDLNIIFKTFHTMLKGKGLYD